MTEELCDYPCIAEAIRQAVKAGVFHRAARLNPRSAKVWNELGATYSKSACEYLEGFVVGRGLK